LANNRLVSSYVSKNDTLHHQKGESKNSEAKVKTILFQSADNQTHVSGDVNEDENIDDEFDDEFVLSRERRGAVNFYRTGTTLARQISSTLDRLLGPSYNKRIRPMFGGPPVVVELNLSIRSIVRFTDLKIYIFQRYS